MERKRLTQIFPFLLPLRQWQRQKCCYLKMRSDKNRYADKISDKLLPNMVFGTESLMVNENSGFDIKYQYNKVYNLKLASKSVSRVLIAPGEVFSLFWLIRDADKDEPYMDGLISVDNETIGAYGGGLCQLSNLLFWCFLHTPLTIVERHGHEIESIPPTDEDIPSGTDATISEGWCDLQARNDTENLFQVEISFDDKNIYGRILSKDPVDTEYKIYNPSLSYVRKKGKVFEIAEVGRMEKDKLTGKEAKRGLYVNECEISYTLPDDIEIKLED